MRSSHFRPHGWSAALVVAALAAGCGGSVINLFPDVPVTEDGGVDAPPADDLPPSEDVSRPDGSGGRCASNADCRADQFCAGTGCGTAGTCQTRPQACPELFSPVCGCDGRTYASAECEANSNGARVAYRGPCNAADGGVDGAVDTGVRTCTTAADCGSAGECVFPETGCARTGVCMLPTPCFRPVTFCGCDGVTYEACRPTRSNRAVGACGGVDAGVDAPADGPVACGPADECPRGQSCCGFTGLCYPSACLGCCMFPPPDAAVDVVTAGCRSASDCTRGQECVYPTTACAASGTCMAAIACLRAETFCSCANETYQGCRPDRPTVSVGACPVSSFCAAVLCAAGTRCCETTRMCQPAGLLCPAPADAGVDAAPDVVTTGCGSNADCRDTQYCAGTGCGTRGTCMDRPGACTTLYAPVCGCDGVTYSNECVARGAGQRAATTGACPTTGRCAAASDCARGQECVYPTTACAASGTCMAAIACLRPETFCSCANETYQGCRPDRPTQSTGACATTSFCATARCTATTFCCEAQRACIPLGTACSTTGACTNDTQCGGTGYACCAGTGRCYDTRCLACCMVSPTGCGSNADCRDTQYCAGTGCGTRGACTDRPTICTRELNPQCGCDRMTYSNPCAAAAAGVRVSSAGACP